MTVYVDLLFGLNTTLNYLLLRGSAAIGGCSPKLWRLLTGAAIGGLYAVGAVIPQLELLQGQLFRFLSAWVMVVAAFGWKKTAVKQGLFFFALSFAFGGMVLLAVEVLEPDCLLLGGRAYYAVTTPALLLPAGLSYGLAALVLRGWGAHTGGDIVSMTVELDGRTVEAKALRDTGNMLRDPVSGRQIPVASRQILEKLLPGTNIGQMDFDDPGSLLVRLRETYPHLRFRLIPYGAVGTASGLLPAVRCTVRQGRRKETLPVAFTATALSDCGQFEILIGGAET